MDADQTTFRWSVSICVYLWLKPSHFRRGGGRRVTARAVASGLADALAETIGLAAGIGGGGGGASFASFSFFAQYRWRRSFTSSGTGWALRYCAVSCSIRKNRPK